MNKTRVLFLCSGNSARSQMAEAFLRSYAGDRFEVHSAGVEPKGYILPEIIAIMKELGIDMSQQVSKSVREYLGKLHFTHVITVCAKAEENCPTIFPGMGFHEFWPFDDPAEFQGSDSESLEAMRIVRDRIDQRIVEWLKAQGVQPATLS